MRDMNPKTVYGFIYLSFCFIAVIMSWSAFIMVNGQNKKLVNVVVEQQSEIFELTLQVAMKNAIIERTREDTVVDVVLALEYILPGVCANELRRTAHIVKKIKAREKNGKH